MLSCLQGLRADEQGMTVQAPSGDAPSVATVCRMPSSSTTARPGAMPPGSAGRGSRVWLLEARRRRCCIAAPITRRAAARRPGMTGGAIRWLQASLPDNQRRRADPRRAVDLQLDGQHQELAVSRRSVSASAATMPRRTADSCRCSFRPSTLAAWRRASSFTFAASCAANGLPASIDRRDAVEPCASACAARVVLRKGARPADPAALVGDRRAHRETLRQRRRLRRAIEAACRRRDRARPRYRLPPRRRAARCFSTSPASVPASSALPLPPRVERRGRDRIGARQQPALGIVDVAAQACEHAVPSIHSTAGAAAAMSSARPAGSVSYSSTPTRFSRIVLASRSPISAPGFGVLTISLSGSVVLIHSDDALRQRGGEHRRAGLRHQQQRVRPVRREAGEPGHRARPHSCWCRRAARRCRPPPSRRAAARAAPPAPRPAAPRHSIPSTRGAWSCLTPQR